MSPDKQKKLLLKGFYAFSDKKYNECEMYARKALAKNGNHKAAAMYLLGQVAKANDNDDIALEYFQKAAYYMKRENCELDKEIYAGIFAMLGYLCYEIGDPYEAANNSYQYYLCCQDPITRLDSFVAQYMALVFTEISAVDFLAKLKTYNRVVSDTLKHFPLKPISKNDNGNEKIHIVYISPDFRQHVMFKFYYNLLAKYDHNRFYVTCVSLGEKYDKYTENIKSLVDNWYAPEHFVWNEVSANIKAMNPDIVVDLAGHSAGSGLPMFGYRLAPVQISGLGWMESTGYDMVDYLITDKYLDPDGSHNISEKPLYLTSQFCYHAADDLPVSMGAPCIRNKYVTFGSFSRINKISARMLGLWKEILDKVPNSLFIVKYRTFNKESGTNVFVKRLMEAGINPDRFILEKATSNYMERYLDVDIALDTYPYCGGGTTFDALYMGVPVVSMYGERRSSRFGLSILSNAGVGELAVPTPEEYVERAVALANDWELLDILHKNLRTMLQKSPAMDAEGYVREIENRYVELLNLC